MGAFHIPSNIDRALNKRSTGDDLIRAVQMDREGVSRGVSSRGQMLLANWIMDDPAARERAFDGRGFDVERLIAGEMLPDNVTMAMIELMTGQAVTFEHWEHRLRIDEPRAVEVAPPSAALRAGDDAGSIPVPASSPSLRIAAPGGAQTCACAPAGGRVSGLPDRGAPEFERLGETAQQGEGAGAPSPDSFLIGRLGERTHGPLFDAVSMDGAIFVAGMGLALRMDEPTASVLAERIEIALGVAADRRARAAGRL